MPKKCDITKGDVTVRIGGEAGFGVMTAASLLSKCAKRAGLYVYYSSEYPSLIRGGHNFCDVRISCRPVHCNRHTVDVLLCMNTDTVEKHGDKITEGGFVLYDSKETQVKACPIHVECLDVPIIDIATRNGGPIMRNVVCVAAALELLDIDLSHLKDLLKLQFAKKGEQVINQNIACAEETQKFIQEHHQHDLCFYCSERHDLSHHVFMTGNDALAMGALKAGCKFMASYPMTPGSSVMETMVKHEKDHDIVLKQTEDEIAAINMVNGAAFAGVRAMAATSGGGFSLMVEAIGAAVQHENGFVVICSSRPGPGTGMATHTGQVDLNLALYCGSDDAPRIVLAPGDVEECFYLGFEAFNLAEEYQMPVIILTDKSLAMSYKTVPAFNHQGLVVRRGKLLKQGDLDNYPDYKRYQLIDGDPISPRAIPGIRNGMHVLSSYEHDEYGTECEDGFNKIQMTRKRFNKLDLAKSKIWQPRVSGPDKADINILSWGSTKMCVDQLMQEMQSEKITIRHMHVNVISPFPTEAVQQFIDSSKKLLLIEQNYSGQFHNLVKMNCRRTIEDVYLQYDGYTINVDQLKQKIRSMMVYAAPHC